MDLKALYKLSYGLYVIGVKNGNLFGGCIVDAFIQATSAKPPHVILCSMNGNHTKDCILAEREFTVSVLPENIDPFVVANFGYQSSRDTMKWANVEFDFMGNLPVLKSAAAYLRCKVLDSRETETHTIFFCEVTDAAPGEGKPLIFGDYLATRKDAALKEFTDFKEGKRTKTGNLV